MIEKNYRFTLIELLVTISLLLVVMSLLQPALQKMILASENLQCQKKLSSINIAYHSYIEDYEGWLPLLGRNRVNYELAPYLDMEVPDHYNQSYMANQVNAENTVWECPSNKVQENPFVVPISFGGYAANYNYLGYLINSTSSNRKRQHISNATKPKDTVVIGDGTDQTDIFWHLRYYMLGSAQSGYKYNRHLGQINVFWLDGSVRYQPWQSIYQGAHNDNKYYFKLTK